MIAAVVGVRSERTMESISSAQNAKFIRDLGARFAIESEQRLPDPGVRLESVGIPTIVMPAKGRTA
jgi:hypothetical protein